MNTAQLPIEFLSMLAAYQRLTGQKKAAVYRFLMTGDATQMNQIARHIQARKKLAK